MQSSMVINNTYSILQARRTVEQLKMETFVERIKVSTAAADLLAYCQAHIEEDPLILPLPISENPFRQKNSTVPSSEVYAYHTVEAMSSETHIARVCPLDLIPSSLGQGSDA